MKLTLTNSSLVPYTTQSTCTVPNCGCDRNHPNAPVPADDEGDAA
jgi:hypothetical protein